MGNVTSASGLRLLTGSFGDTEWRVIVTSLSFGIFSSTAAAGAAVRLRRDGWAQALGAAAMGASLAGFVLLMAAIWLDDSSDGLWRAWGIAGLAALWTAHASLILRPLRPSDSGAVRSLTGVAVIALGIDTAAMMLLIAGVDPDGSEVLARALAVVLVAAVLTTALVPILRRMARQTRQPVPAADGHAAFGTASRRDRETDLSAEIAGVAARLHALPQTPELRSEVARLRDLAGRAARGERV
jgi:hypothetical protein